MRRVAQFALLCWAMSAAAQPVADHHQHLFHPADTGLAPADLTVTTKDLIPYLDLALYLAL